jgi:hypothetical protein
MKYKILARIMRLWKRCRAQKFYPARDAAAHKRDGYEPAGLSLLMRRACRGPTRTGVRARARDCALADRNWLRRFGVGHEAGSAAAFVPNRMRDPLIRRLGRGVAAICLLPGCSMTRPEEDGCMQKDVARTNCGCVFFQACSFRNDCQPGDGRTLRFSATNEHLTRSRQQ